MSERLVVPDLIERLDLAEFDNGDRDGAALRTVRKVFDDRGAFVPDERPVEERREQRRIGTGTARVHR